MTPTKNKVHFATFWESYKPKSEEFNAFRRASMEMNAPSLINYKKLCDLFLQVKIKITSDGCRLHAYYPGTSLTVTWFRNINAVYFRGNYIPVPHWFYVTRYLFQIHKIASKIEAREQAERERQAWRYKQLMKCYECYRAAVNESDYEFDIDLDAIYDEL